MSSLLGSARIIFLILNLTFSMLLSFIIEGVSKKYQSSKGGLNDAGRAYYNSKGHNLKEPVSSKQAKKSPKAAKRRKSFCSRMEGQKKMHNIDCRENPDKSICKALSRWDC